MSLLGSADSAAGGDFRFQGQWLESESGLYNFRARDYDPVTGLFLSRDPVDIIETQPESFNPYQFVYNNPYIYNDPTGMFTLTELSTGQSLQNQLATVRTIAANQARDYLRDRIQSIASDLLVDTISSFIPGANLLKAIRNGTLRQRGIEFEEQFTGDLCNMLGEQVGSLLLYVYLEAEIKANGDPASNGFNCNRLDLVDFIRNSNWVTESRPDFIISPVSPKENISTGTNGWIVGDFKWRVRTIADSISSRPSQFKAMTNYAKRYQDFPVVSFIIAYQGRVQDYKDVAKEGLERNVIVLVLSV